MLLCSMATSGRSCNHNAVCSTCTWQQAREERRAVLRRVPGLGQLSVTNLGRRLEGDDHPSHDGDLLNERLGDDAERAADLCRTAC